MQTLYRCNICGFTSEDKDRVLKCEGIGKPKELFNIGDKIMYKDCKETPIAFSRMENIKLYGNCVNEIDYFWSTCWKIGSILQEYKIVDIKICGHNISYILGKSNSVLCSLNFTHDLDHADLKYPIVRGNELMNKIIELYN